MTVSTTGSKSIGMGNGATVAWPFTFKVIDHSSVVVTYTNTAGVDTALTLANYDIVFNSNGIGGTVTYPRPASGAAPIPTGSYVTIQRIVAFSQPTDIVNQGSFNPSVLENGLDNLELQIQQISEIAARAIVFPPSNLSPTQLPGAAARANRLIGFDASGNLYLSLQDALSAAAAAASAAAALVAQHAAEAAAQLAVDLSQAQYTQVGTGAVADKFADFDKRIPMAEQFGALCNGSNDDADGIRKCLAAFGRCSLAAGRIYTLKSTVVVDIGQELSGLGGKAFLQWGGAANAGFTMVEMRGDSSLANLTFYATGAFYGIWINSGGAQQITRVSVTGAYGHSVNIDGSERFTNYNFQQSPPMTGWTLGGAAAYDSGFARLTNNGDFIRQQVTGLLGGAYMQVAALIDLTSALGALVCDIGTTAGGTDILNGGLLSGVNYMGIAGQGFLWAVMPVGVTSAWITIRRNDSIGGNMRVGPVSAKQAAPGTGMVWLGSGEYVINAPIPTTPTTWDYAISLPAIDPSVVGDRRFANLNGGGTKMFALNGANLTEIRDCMMGGVNWDIPQTASYVYVGGGRVAANINVASSNFSIEGCQVGGKITIMAGTAFARIDGSNKLSQVEFGLGVVSSTYIHNPGNGTFTNNSGNTTNIILGLQATDGTPLFPDGLNAVGTARTSGFGPHGVIFTDISADAGRRNFGLLGSGAVHGRLDLMISSVIGGTVDTTLMAYGESGGLGYVQHFGGALGFYGAAAVAKPTVAGSKGGNAALGSLMTALASLGLVADTTT